MPSIPLIADFAAVILFLSGMLTERYFEKQRAKKSAGEMEKLISSDPALKQAHFNKNGLLHHTEKRLRENYTYINPLLSCTQEYSANPIHVTKLSGAIERFIAEQRAANTLIEASVYYRDLNNGPWFGINEDLLFSPASLIKVPMMMAVFKMAEKAPSLLSQKIVVKDIDSYLTQDYMPSRKLEAGVQYSVYDLVLQMIAYSDNRAYEALKEVVLPEILERVYEDLDVDISKAATDPGGNILSIKQYGAFFRILYNSSYLSKNYSEEALKILARTVFMDGLVAGVPVGVTVSHKFGERIYENSGERQLHDCGIIFKENRPYLIAVMTRGTDFVALAGIIEKISEMVYKAEFEGHTVDDVI